MKRIPLFKGFLVTTVLALWFGADTSMAQHTAPLKLEPVTCTRIQEQVNEVVRVSRSPSISYQEKVALISKSWAESVSAMRNKSESEDQSTKLVNQLGKAMGQFLALALVPSASGDKTGSSDGQSALNDIRKHVKSYVSFMKMLCPDLTLPEGAVP